MIKDTSPDVGGIVQSIGDALKLQRHSVMGKEDVDTTDTEIAADVELFVAVQIEDEIASIEPENDTETQAATEESASQTTLVVINTANLFPSEPPSETEHLDQSTRHM